VPNTFKLNAINSSNSGDRVPNTFKLNALNCASNAEILDSLEIFNSLIREKRVLNRF